MSIIALWVLVLFETVLLLLLLRALGELRQKGVLSSANHLQSPEMGGLDVGTQAPSFVATDIAGNNVQLEDFHGQWNILAFISPDCPACTGTIEALNAVLHSTHDTAVVVIGGPDREQNRVYADEHDAQLPILTPALGFDKELFRVERTPFVFVLDEAGVVRARGVVNGEKHLRELLMAARTPLPVPVH